VLGWTTPHARDLPSGSPAWAKRHVACNVPITGNGLVGAVDGQASTPMATPAWTRGIVNKYHACIKCRSSVLRRSSGGRHQLDDSYTLAPAQLIRKRQTPTYEVRASTTRTYVVPDLVRPAWSRTFPRRHAHTSLRTAYIGSMRLLRLCIRSWNHSSLRTSYKDRKIPRTRYLARPQGPTRSASYGQVRCGSCGYTPLVAGVIQHY
jgi:hypothetical protein